jgi:F5/8 type C domain
MRKLLFFTLMWANVGLSQPSVLTWHNDNARTGRNLQETQLTLTNVNQSSFGLLFNMPVDGLVDAEPLYVPRVFFPSQGTHNVVYVASEHDSVYAFDADTGMQLWQVSLILSGEETSDERNCGQVPIEIGITSTPVIDPNMGPHGTIYVVAMSKTTAATPIYHQRIHALDLTTGAEEFGGPLDVQASYPQAGGGSTTFDPKQYKERAALMLWNGIVYTTFTSHCDIAPYSAWVIGYSESTLSQASVLNLTPNGSLGSIWQSGAGAAADTSGNMFALLANGTFDTNLNAGGFPVSGDYGNAFVKIAAGGTSVADYFTMDNTVSESSVDLDLGSGGPMVLPPVTDSQGRLRLLAVGAGKDGNIYVVDRNNMGKFVSNTDKIFQLMSRSTGGVWSSPAWFNGTMYYGSVAQPLNAFGFSGQFATTALSGSSENFEYPGTTPSISANGLSNGIVWAAENSNPAVLHAYEASSLATELYNSNQAPNGRDHFGVGNKFIVPMVANGKVYVGTTTGVGAFGLLDLALNKPTVQSSTFAPGFSDASKAADGNTDGNYFDGSLSTTNDDANAWWEVDLGASATVSSIVVWNRTDGSQSRLSDYWVFVSDTPFASTDTPATLQSRAGTFSNHQTTQPNPSSTITLTNAQGRYVRVQLSGTNYLSLAEVQVFGSLLTPAVQDVVPNGMATQSSTFSPGYTDASKAADGDTDGNYFDGSLSTTGDDVNAWWEVDLGASATVTSIVVWNRTDGSQSRLSDYWVFVSDTPFASTDTPSMLQNRAGTFSSHQTTQPNPTSVITIAGAQGRYVRVQLSGTNYLSLAEVQVFGSLVAQGPHNLALNRTATQSSSLLPGATDAPAAADGMTDGNFFDGSLASTNQDAHAWWQIDLGVSAAVNSVVVWNRTDGSQSRLSDYWVFVSNTPFSSTDTPTTLQNRAGTFSSHQTVAPSPSSAIVIPGAQGRYVRVQLSGTNYLSLAEVQIFGNQ